MKIKLITLTAATALSVAMAQENSGNVELVPIANAPAAAPAAPAPAPAPAPAAPQARATAPAAPAATADTANAAKPKALHGIAYNNVGNQAADATIVGNLNKPYTMAGSKLVYMEPTSEYAAVAFGEGSTKFIAFERSSSLGLATLGFASKSFGASLSYALGKEILFTKTRDAYEQEEESAYTVSNGDIIRLRAAMPLGAFDVNVSAFWLTYANETSTSEEQKDADGKASVDVDNDYWDLGATIDVSNDPSAKSLFWNFGVILTRHENAYTRETKSGSSSTKTETTGKDAHLYIQPSFNIGGAILQSQTARVLLGLNTRAPLVFYDEFDDTRNKNKDSYFTMGVYTSPNIFAEIALGNCWQVYGGADYIWTVFTMEKEEFISDYNDELDIVKSNATRIRSRTGAATVSIGTRFHYENFAVEGSIANTFYSNPFRGFADATSNFIANVGGFIYF